jgi:hypothetical protein
MDIVNFFFYGGVIMATEALGMVETKGLVGSIEELMQW